MMGLANEIAGGTARVGLMRAGVDRLDNQIRRLEAERRGADPSHGLAIGHQIRALEAERSSSRELLDEAERRAMEGQKAFRDAEDAAIRDLGKISSAAGTAAKRVDEALRDAAEAMDELAEVCGPLRLTLMPSGSVERRLKFDSVVQALRVAFEARLKPAELQLERRSMASAIGDLLADCRSNAGRVAKAREETAERERLARGAYGKGVPA